MRISSQVEICERSALGRSGLSSFRNFESIINFNAKIPYGTLQLGVSEQELDGS